MFRAVAKHRQKIRYEVKPFLSSLLLVTRKLVTNKVHRDHNRGNLMNLNNKLAVLTTNFLTFVLFTSSFESDFNCNNIKLTFVIVI